MKINTLIISGLSIFCLLTSCNRKKEYIKRDDWQTNVKNNINKFLAYNGKNGKNYSNNNYVVFDFDNTCSIFDIEEQTIIYQLKHMAYNITKEEMPIVLSSKLDISKQLQPYGYKGTYSDWISDISSSYYNLYDKYGPFTSRGINENKLEELHQNDDWKNFSCKIRKLYDIIYDAEPTSISFPWITYLFYGMSEEEIYNLAAKSHAYYSTINSEYETLTSPNMGIIGETSVTYTNGVAVSKNIYELIKQLHENDIKVWICSASLIDVVKAAVDIFDLHDYVTGVLAMTNKFKNGKMINEYDYEGVGSISKPHLTWKKDNLIVGAQTQAEGKVVAINNALKNKSRYNKGPIAGFMDTTGDFNFCTEYESLQLVTCFNRGDRSVCDGGGLIGAIAMYQQDTLKYTFEDTIKNNETLYLLQGRNENDVRSFINSNKTIKLNASEERLFKNEDNYKLLNYIKENQLKIGDAINKFAIKKEALAKDNPLKIKYGFLDEYSGYHSIK